jgi:hypothetical protein
MVAMRNSESLYPAFLWNEAQMHHFPALGLGGWAEVPQPGRIIRLKSALHFCNCSCLSFLHFGMFFTRLQYN